MAAGRCHVSRKRDFRVYSDKEKYDHTNGFHGVEFGRGRDDRYIKHRFGDGSNGARGGDQSVGRATYQEDGGPSDAAIRATDAFDDGTSILDDRTSKIQEGTKISPLKKRKFSPILWKRDNKGVRVMSRNRIAPARTLLSSTSSSSISVGKVPNVVLNGTSRRYPVATSQIQGLDISPIKHPEVHAFVGSALSEPSGSPRVSLLEEQHSEDVQEAEQMEEGEYIKTQSISMSKWAIELNCTSGEDFAVEELHVGSSKTKSDADSDSGEFRRKVFKRSSEKSSGTDKSDRSVPKTSADEYSENGMDEGYFVGVNEFADMSMSNSDSEDDNNSCRMHGSAISKYRNINMLHCCRSVFEYEKLNKVNEGAYGVVYRAKDKKTGDIVALKKVKMGSQTEGFPVSSLREINLLMAFHHPSIVDVKEVVMDNHDGIFVAMEYMEHDLKDLMTVMEQPFSQSEVKCLMLQLLEGVKYLHDNWVLHRDLKTSNLLLNNRSELKICDFGLSRQYGSPLKPYTPLVVTLWYRAPELLLGTKHYSTAVDMWSVGCIMAELLSKKALFSGETEIEQLRKIFSTLGMPNDTIWPGFSSLPGARVNFVNQQHNILRKQFPAATFTGSPVLTERGFDLLNKLLTYDPEKRITAEAALNHGWFREVPLPKSKEFMPTFPVHPRRNR